VKGMDKVEKFLDKLGDNSKLREIEWGWGKIRVRVATPVSSRYVDSIEELVKELDRILRSSHITGGVFSVVKFADEIRAESNNIVIEVGRSGVLIESKTAGIGFTRDIEDLTEVVAGEEVISFRFKDPKQSFVIYPVTGHISVSWY